MAKKSNVKSKSSAAKKTAQSTAPKPVMLALQGGGAHGAFTWGALDQLLLDGRIKIEAISAASGGALNAVVMASGYLDGGAQGAMQRLSTFWKKVSVAASLLPLRVSVVDKMLSSVGMDFSTSSVALDTITRLFSPYQFNLFDINPLRGILEEVVDFEQLRRNKKIRLFINATDVRTGKVKIFGNEELSLEAAMGSACLPFVFKTVELDGAAYWDGGYSGNPALYPLCRSQPWQDLLIVQNTPFTVEEIPTKAADILDRVTEISFNASLMQELRHIHHHNELIRKKLIRDSGYRPLYLHLVESQELLTSLGRASKLSADWDFLVYLHDLGAQATTDWLEGHFNKLGKTSSMDVEKLVF